MKKIVSIVMAIAIIITTMSLAPAFAATKYDWVKNTTDETQVSFRWPTVSVKGNGSNVADVDWDKLPETLGNGRIFKDLAKKDYWSVTLGGVSWQHVVGVKSDDDESFTEYVPVAFAFGDKATLKALGYETRNVMETAQILGADVLRHADGLTAVATVVVEDDVPLLVWQWKDGSVGGFFKTPDEKIAIGRRVAKAQKTNPNPGISSGTGYSDFVPVTGGQSGNNGQSNNGQGSGTDYSGFVSVTGNQGQSNNQESSSTGGWQQSTDGADFF
jgi:hypothetical protein